MDGRRLCRFEVKVPEAVAPEMFAMRFMMIEGVRGSTDLVRMVTTSIIGWPSRWPKVTSPWVSLKVPHHKIREFRLLATSLGLDKQEVRRKRRRQ